MFHRQAAVSCRVMVVCDMVFDTCIAGVTKRTGTSGDSGECHNVSGLGTRQHRKAILPPESHRLRITARQTALRNLGKQAVQQLCAKLGVLPIPNNLTAMIEAATNAEELLLEAEKARERQGAAAGNACCVTGICWYVTVHIRSGR